MCNNCYYKVQLILTLRRADQHEKSNGLPIYGNSLLHMRIISTFAPMKSDTNLMQLGWRILEWFKELLQCFSIIDNAASTLNWAPKKWKSFLDENIYSKPRRLTVNAVTNLKTKSTVWRVH